MKKVLVFLLICLSSTVMFAQDLHWTMVTTGVAGMNTSMTGVLYIDHEMHPNPEFLEIGVFDQNDDVRFTLNRVVKGWQEGLQLIGEGGHADHDQRYHREHQHPDYVGYGELF